MRLATRASANATTTIATQPIASAVASSRRSSWIPVSANAK